MAVCLLQSMSCTMQIDYSQTVSNFYWSSVWRNSCRLSRRCYTRTGTKFSVSTGGKLGKDIGDGGSGHPRMENLGHAVEMRDNNLSATELSSYNDILLRTAVLIACPSLGLSMFDSNALAGEVDPVSPLTLAADKLPHFVLFLSDLDPGTAQLATSFVGPLIAVFNLLFIFRIVMSWYPGIPVKRFPFYLVYNPTEPVLGPTRRLIPPVGGVDVAPVIWVAFMSFTNEILLGKQGLLVLLSQQQS